MMYGEELTLNGRGHGSRDAVDSDSDEEPTTLQNDDDDSSDDDDDDDDGGHKTSVKTRELEWDDSTLSY